MLIAVLLLLLLLLLILLMLLLVVSIVVAVVVAIASDSGIVVAVTVDAVALDSVVIAVVTVMVITPPTRVLDAVSFNCGDIVVAVAGVVADFIAVADDAILDDDGVVHSGRHNYNNSNN